MALVLPMEFKNLIMGMLFAGRGCADAVRCGAVGCGTAEEAGEALLWFVEWYSVLRRERDWWSGLCCDAVTDGRWEMGECFFFFVPFRVNMRHNSLKNTRMPRPRSTQGPNLCDGDKETATRPASDCTE